MNWKRIALIIGFILVVLAVGYAIYYFFFREVVAPPPPANVPEIVNGVPVPLVPANARPPRPPAVNVPPAPVGPVPSPIAAGGLTAVAPLSTAPTTGASMSTSGNLSFYDRNDGKFYHLKPDGTLESLSNQVFYNVQNATFNPQGNGAIIEYPDRTKIFYDFNAQRQYTIPRHWEDFGFNPTGDKIIAKSITTDPASRFLIVSNPDGSQARPIQELGENQDQVQVAWSPSNAIVATATTGESYGLDSKEVFFIGQNQENFRSMRIEGLDFRPLWDPDGMRLLYSVTGSVDDWKPVLWIVDANGDNIGLNRTKISVNTWADKCTFASSSIVYCGVPNELVRGAGLQPSVNDSVPDSIYRIDLSTGLQTKIAEPEGTHTVDKIMLSQDGKKLIFTDKGSGLINEITLSE